MWSFIVALVVAWLLLAYWRAALAILLLVVIALLIVGVATVVRNHAAAPTGHLRSAVALAVGSRGAIT